MHWFPRPSKNIFSAKYLSRLLANAHLKRILTKNIAFYAFRYLSVHPYTFRSILRPRVFPKCSLRRACNLRIRTFPIFLEYMAIYSNSINKHTGSIYINLINAVITLQIKRFKFFSEEDDFLGHIRTARKFKIDSAHIAFVKRDLPLKTSGNRAPF